MGAKYRGVALRARLVWSSKPDTLGKPPRPLRLCGEFTHTRAHTRIELPASSFKCLNNDAQKYRGVALRVPSDLERNLRFTMTPLKPIPEYFLSDATPSNTPSAAKYRPSANRLGL